MDRNGKKQFKHSEAIHLVGNKKNMLEEKLQKFEGARHVRKYVKHHADAVRVLEQTMQMNKALGMQKIPGVCGIMYNEHDIFMPGSENHKAAIAQATANVDRAYKALNQAKLDYNLSGVDVSKPSHEELELEHQLSIVTNKYDELKKDCSDTVELDVPFYETSVNIDSISNDAGSISSPTNMQFR